MKNSHFIKTIHNSLLLSLMSRGWAVLCLLLVLTACSSSDDEGITEQPQPAEQTDSNLSEALKPGSDQRPNWAEPDYSSFEFVMSIQVQLGDTLAAYQSDADLMCATIDGEVRAVSSLFRTEEEPYFSLSIASNGSNSSIGLSYYCDKLHRIYTIKDWAVFNPSAAPAGDNGIYRPKFIDNSK